MKKLAVLILTLLPVLPVCAQITITDADMPSVGDTFRVSDGLITPAIDPIPTGASFLWDFSALQWITQDVDSFVSVSSTGPIYSVVFIDISFNPYRANMAARGPELPSVPQVSISDVNYFYYKTASSYKLSGYGALINGISAPIPFDNKDRIYSFPLNFGNTDSSDSDFQLSLPGLGYYSHDQHRVNEVDGWGTLITPYGTFNTLRIKSVITSNDSIYLDTLGTGFAFSLPQTIEYKWLGEQEGVPLLQINTTLTLGTEVVSSIRYRDSLRVLPTGIPAFTTTSAIDIAVYPNPVEQSMEVEFNLSTDEKVSLVKKGSRSLVRKGTIRNTQNVLRCRQIPFCGRGLFYRAVNRTAAKTSAICLYSTLTASGKAFSEE
jgi:hypothetical protein